jgi:hypothetical protein
MILLATVTRKPDHRGEHEASRKTIAQGMPGETGVTVVTTLVCFVSFRTRGYGCNERPAFPVPSDLQKAECSLQSSGINREIAELWLLFEIATCNPAQNVRVYFVAFCK